MIKARVICAAAVLASAGAGTTACAALWPPARAQQGITTVVPLSSSCHLGYISQGQSDHSTFTAGAHGDVNGYEVTFTNKNPGRTGTVEEAGIGFYGASGAEIGSDIPVGSKTIASGNIPVAPGHALSVIFYGPDSGIGITGDAAPANWVPDRHMPSRANRCQVLSLSVGWAMIAP
jgi:hypothetical protein